MPYSPEMQKEIDERTKAQKTGGLGLSLPMPRLRHDGKTGEWMVRELEGTKNAEIPTVFETEGATPGKIIVDAKKKKTRDGMIGGAWTGSVIRVAWMSQTKWKEGALFRKFTREFTDFKQDKIELLKQVFGPAGKSETVGTYVNYADFKARTMLKDEDGQPMQSAYDLKAVLYIYHPGRKQILKLTLGGSARSEWFEYASRKPSGDERVHSKPWALSPHGMSLLEGIETKFVSSEAINEQGLPYHRIHLEAVGSYNEEQLREIWAAQDTVKDWVKSWEVAQASQNVVGTTLDRINAMAPSKPLAQAEAAASMTDRDAAAEMDDDIDVNQIPF